MFALSPDQIRLIEALLTPFGLILLVQAAKWLARRLGADFGRAQIRLFLALLAAALAYLFLAPVWPALPQCAAPQACLAEISAFLSALLALGSAWFGAAHLIYERLARGLFAQLGLD